MENNIRKLWEFEGEWEGEGRNWSDPQDPKPKTQDVKVIRI